MKRTAEVRTLKARIDISMAKEDKNSIRNKIITGVSTALILSAVFYVVPGIFRWATSILGRIYHYFTSSTTLPRWLLCIFVILSAVTLIREISRLLKRDSDSEP